MLRVRWYGVALLLLGHPYAAKAQDNASATPLTWAEAEPWNVTVARAITLTNAVSSEIDFSADEAAIIYVSAEATLTNVSHYLTIRKLPKLGLLQQILLPENSADYLGNTPQLALSPDRHTAIIGPAWRYTGEGTNATRQLYFYFVKLDTLKVLQIPYPDSNAEIWNLTWIDSTHLYVRSTPDRSWDIDTLTISALSNSIPDKAPIVFGKKRGNGFPLSYIHVGKANLIDEVVSNQDQSTLAISTPDDRFSKELYTTKGLSSIEWRKDLQYVTFRIIGKHPAALVLELGLCASPQLNFEVTGLNARLSPQERNRLEATFGRKNAIKANVYSAQINPLNDRIVGPDLSHYKGQVLVTQLCPVIKLYNSRELEPLQPGDVVTGIQAEEGIELDLGNTVWGQLAQVGKGETNYNHGAIPFGRGIVNAETRQPAYTPRQNAEGSTNPMALPVAPETLPSMPASGAAGPAPQAATPTSAANPTTTVELPEDRFHRLVTAIPNADKFTAEIETFNLPFNRVWPAVLSTLRASGDNIELTDPTNGILITAETKHDELLYVNFYKYCLFVDGKGDDATEVTCKLFQSHPDAAGQHVPMSPGVVEARIKQFFRKVQRAASAK